MLEPDALGSYLQAMQHLASARDIDTRNHAQRTQRVIRVLAEYLANEGYYEEMLNAKNIQCICAAAPLHDIGKIHIPDRILLKPVALSAEEREEMKLHTFYGYEMLIVIQKKIHVPKYFLKTAKGIVLHHHEWWDGTGYPFGLSGERIPLAARLMAIADVYDALVSKRPYKNPVSHDEAHKIIVASKGKQFDPVLVDAFEAINECFYNRVEVENKKLSLFSHKRPFVNTADNQVLQEFFKFLISPSAKRGCP